MEETSHSHEASNGRATLSLDDLAVLHGGLAHFMVEISDRATRCYQACRAQNRRVALHQLSELTKTLQLAAIVRPQYSDAIGVFTANDLTTIRDLIDEERWVDFDEVWRGLESAVNKSHTEFDHGYLIWRVPADAPSEPGL